MNLCTLVTTRQTTSIVLSKWQIKVCALQYHTNNTPQHTQYMRISAFLHYMYFLWCWWLVGNNSYDVSSDVGNDSDNNIDAVQSHEYLVRNTDDVLVWLSKQTHEFKHSHVTIPMYKLGSIWTHFKI